MRKRVYIRNTKTDKTNLRKLKLEYCTEELEIE